MSKYVLVTGGAGYIGSVLIRQLLEQGYAVNVVDDLKWGAQSLASVLKDARFSFIKGDLREGNIQDKVLEGIDAVIHLAAIVGDPACKKEPKLAEDVNWHASKSLFDRAVNSGVKRFIFASTCSNYGKMPDSNKYINEAGILNPVSLYAELKVRFEQYFLQRNTDSTAVTSLRFATAYGVSPRMRFDLTVNEFVKEAVLGRELVVFGKYFWRPYCHVKDLARACIYVLEADKNLIHKEVFNVGDTTENYQKHMIVELIKKRLPNTEVRVVDKDEDPRDYRVDFNKIKKRLKFQITKTVPDGIDEIIRIIDSGLIKDPDSNLFKNI